MRINKFLAQAGVCSRRQADQLISAGRIKINQKIARLGDQVNASDQVEAKGQIVRNQAGEKVYLAFYKPVGLICTCDPKAKDNIINYINYSARIYPIGRLDVSSSGLILLTNDGEIVNKILKGKSKVEKEYIVDVDKSLTSSFLTSLRKGVILDNYRTLPARVAKLADKKFSLTIVEGKNRQLRRMCEKLGYQVKKLIRVRIGSLKLGTLKEGEYKKLSSAQIKKLLNQE